LADADVRACRAILREGSRTFRAASLLLPRGVGDAAAALYAFCRVADHAVDEPDGGGGPAVPRLERRLARVYGEDELDRPVDRAFRAVVREHRIPRAVPEALLEGLRWDEEGRRYGDLAGLCGYAVRVGSTVGVMMTIVMGRRDARTLADAAELGIAMQLTNVARDVGEDARRGRIYLPLDRLRAAGLDPDAWLRAPSAAPAVRTTVAGLLDESDALYARSWDGIARLPAGCRPAIRAASLLYAEIGNEVRAAGCDSVTRRAWTSRGTKLRLLARAAATGRRPRGAFAGATRATLRSEWRPEGDEPVPDAARRAAEPLVRAACG
jgi:15-cis-phytoene synthase